LLGREIPNRTPVRTRGKVRKTIKAQTLWFATLDAQVETVPHMFQGCCNRKSNQQNLGTIMPNLCNEIVEYTAPDEYVQLGEY
jgi:hypothetical protein